MKKERKTLRVNDLKAILITEHDQQMRNYRFWFKEKAESIADKASNEYAKSCISRACVLDKVSIKLFGGAIDSLR
jgi:hypothetical protein